jgi:hypothetical protein
MDNLIYYILPGVLAFFVVWILFKTITGKSGRTNGILVLVVIYAVVALSIHYILHYLL